MKRFSAALCLVGLLLQSTDCFIHVFSVEDGSRCAHGAAAISDGRHAQAHHDELTCTVCLALHAHRMLLLFAEPPGLSGARGLSDFSPSESVRPCSPGLAGSSPRSPPSFC